MTTPIEGVRQMLAELLGGPDASIDFRREQSRLFVENQPPPPEGIRIENSELGGVPVEWVVPQSARAGPVFLHLHGGGYVMGDPVGSRAFTAGLAEALGASVVSVDYRLGPAHPFPAAVEDATAAYAALLQSGVLPAAIAIGGESAGGGLAIATLLAARARGLPMPACAVALSPWTDLTCEGDSYEALRDRDPLLTREILLEMAAQYLAGAEARGPWASPALADLTGLPPLLIQVGADEVLLDDARRLAERARADGVDVELEIWSGMIHVWQMFVAVLPEGREAIARIAAFVSEHLREEARGYSSTP